MAINSFWSCAHLAVISLSALVFLLKLARSGASGPACSAGNAGRGAHGMVAARTRHARAAAAHAGSAHTSRRGAHHALPPSAVGAAAAVPSTSDDVPSDAPDSTDTFGTENPVLGVDVNILFHSAARSHLGFGVQRLAEVVFGELRRFLDVGFDLLIVYDAPERHPSKESSILRHAEQRMLEAKIAEISHAIATVPTGSDVKAQRAELRALKARMHSVPDGLWDALQQGFARDEAWAQRVRFVVAPWQADSQLAHFAAIGECDTVFSSDGDLLVLGAPLVLRFGMKKVPSGSVEIATLNPDVFEPFKAQLSDVRMPTYRNVFCPGDAPLFLALCAVILGCDVLLKGVPRTGIATLASWVKKCHDRSFSQLLKKCRCMGVPLQLLELEAQAFAFEPVYSSLKAVTVRPVRNTFSYRHGVAPPATLPRFLGEFALSGVAVVAPTHDSCTRWVVPCANGHEVLQHHVAIQCGTCERFFCDLCAVGAPPGNDDEHEYQCPDCFTISLRLSSSGVPPEQHDVTTRSLLDTTPLPGFSSLFHLVSTTDVPAVAGLLRGSIELSSFQCVSECDLHAFINAFGIQGDTNWTRQMKEEIALAIVHGEIFSTLCDPSPDNAILRTRAREQASAGAVPRDLVWWAFDEPELVDSCTFDSDFFDALKPEDLLFTVELVGALLEREAEATEENAKGFHGAFMMRSARLATPIGSPQCVLSKAVSAASADWTAPVTCAQAGVVWGDKGPCLVLHMPVHSSYRRKETYNTTVWLGVQQVVAAKCSCCVGKGICHHALAVVAMLESLVLLPAHSLVECIVDAFARRCATEELLTSEFWGKLKPLLVKLHPETTYDASLRAKVRPGTEKAKLAPLKPRHSDNLEHLPAEKLVFTTPLRMEQVKRKRGVDASEALRNPPSERLETYTPFPEWFDPTIVDCVQIFESFKESCADPDTMRTHLHSTAFFWWLGLRAAEQRAQRAATAAQLAAFASAEVPPMPLPPMQPRKRARECHDGDGAAPETKRARGSWQTKCAFPKCSCTNVTCPGGSTGWHAVPIVRVDQKKKPKQYAKKMRRRHEYLRRLGYGHPDSAPLQLRVCSCHAFDKEALPCTEGLVASSPPRRESRGLAADRYKRGFLMRLDESARVIVAMSEVADEDATELAARPTVADVEQAFERGVMVGKNAPLRFADVAKNPQQLYELSRFASVVDFEAFLDFLCNGDRRVLEQLHVFRPENVVAGDYELPESRGGRTGKSGKHKLTYRDWFLMYFMFEWQPEATVKHLALRFKVSEARALNLITTCAVVVSKRHEAFGLFPTAKEYAQLVPEEWQKKYPGTRVHMWDTTNVRLLGKPLSEILNYLTYSEYYSSNCLKAGIGTTPFGLLLRGNLWTGGTWCRVGSSRRSACSSCATTGPQS